MVLLNERSGRYWQLNGTGAIVVRVLQEGSTPQAAVQQLLERYPSVPAEQARRDVEGLIEALVAARLVTDE